ncbi:alpha/beta fold hydrolase [Weissella halotolerans]|uniref:Halo peroxidase n=1 Tax=Weissella halotolerans DSM 20190 TaxID=1123500 RepID=A0A0R2G1T6_9LACO|nr:alpha/beta hydrolase [Weissella halotolerans]KRN33430.1 halo peroxidase [Weissella halotolerans DSM 20190]
MAVMQTTDGTQLFYEDNGLKGHPTLIFLHGFSGNHAEFLAQQTFFTEQGYRVILLDWRNHGQSARVTYGLRISQLANDLDQVLSYLDLTSVQLVAHSMGAAVGWAYLSLYGSQRIQSIITIDQSPQGLNSTNWPYGFCGYGWQELATVLQVFPKIKMTAHRLPDTTFEAIRTLQAQFPFDLAANQGLLRDHLIQDWRDVLSRLTVPTLLIAGAQSPLWSPQHAEVAANLVPQQLGKVAIIEQSGHLPHAEQPRIFNQVVERFLNKLI